MGAASDGVWRLVVIAVVCLALSLSHSRCRVFDVKGSARSKSNYLISLAEI